MSWFWTILLLSFVLSNCSEAEHDQKKVPSAVVVGTVYCDTCFQQNFHEASHFIAGASVAVECKKTRSTESFRQEVKTNNHGQFEVHLPFPISTHTKKIQGCSVKLISSNQPYCSIAATATSSRLHLKSRKQGTHIFSAGFFTFKPLKQPELCDQKPKKLINNAEKSSTVSNPNDPTFPPPLQDPPSDPPALGRNNLPPLPQLPNLPPLPPLPRLPPIPGIPFLPPIPKKENPNKSPQLSENPTNQQDSFIFPPNPLNPPSILPPNPLLPPPSLIPPIFPSPPSSIFPPLIPSPPPSIFPPILPSPPSRPSFPFPLPPFPGLVPSPPPPPPPLFPIPLPPLPPLPPFPFQPTPGFPGVPPAKVSSPSKTSSP
ncbi:hypothetical protein CDL12_21088 [Handroanthus impetiginosus]|uniref:Uncharacterized protein n=1 Tax=Handroanthus impetiginosus TaxID=429701 RepID=A0A2G9GM77_9LAMI|nr:hypothetical protein CDL12_21088 [Handroanthus impetiginosus]